MTTSVRDIQDVFARVADDLGRVDERVIRAGSVPYPLVASLLGDIVAARGKRLRPLLLILANRAFCPSSDRVISAAAGVELLHIASLIHDDSIDHAALRRGQPTLNSSLSSGAVILVGDYLFAQSAILAAETGIPRIVSIFASTLGDICDGQLREMFDAHRLEQSREDYERRIYGKTASLFAGAAEMGAYLGDADEVGLTRLRTFGMHLGLAYQIMDDVLDFRANADILGKPSGNDLREGVVTLPTMLFAEALSPGDPVRQALTDVIGGQESDRAAIDRLVAKIRSSGVLEAATTEAEHQIVLAKTEIALLDRLDVVDMLGELADFVLSRSS
ncbi:MAG: Octaprenyl diphosphate synthase / Dimethylallyltransferase / (2E,6E)-farnesyl diphosphate synthase / Geranylgeranyl pyrophosphate synthetase [uncultured Thermomicrobiales bacterium]|uniref:Octaprenyl diphosphate synthase / Dimethylallyltransferase / (2E,6E)-farnesyl diphosphate synthase / Geranylgeranyl pyrophosphate synthetase n=1 Tax=uncultured Thermomicrobiales bacterium TaxID=1645740 RepID=A0A6J4V240_9BACT|nr:MAG: Octaprenyl diphosphate synthase / Dimethylallyltransferase / (2E,6E)-farnesyl diphosphate synthase / Geranylgeranyl pyrophosphate synthetase [uncultured Thermomicrobiales bacterium]